MVEFVLAIIVTSQMVILYFFRDLVHINIEYLENTEKILKTKEDLLELKYELEELKDKQKF